MQERNDNSGSSVPKKRSSLHYFIERGTYSRNSNSLEKGNKEISRIKLLELIFVRHQLQVLRRISVNILSRSIASIAMQILRVSTQTQSV